MRILTAADGFPSLPPAEIGMIRRAGVPTALMDAITEHIAASLDNISSGSLEENGETSGSHVMHNNRVRNELMFSSW